MNIWKRVRWAADVDIHPAGRLRENTLCRAGWHCPPSKRIRKYDNGRCPLLCCYCYLIVGRWRS